MATNALRSFLSPSYRACVTTAISCKIALMRQCFRAYWNLRASLRQRRVGAPSVFGTLPEASRVRIAFCPLPSARFAAVGFIALVAILGRSNGFAQTQGAIAISSQSSQLVCGFFDNLPGVKTVHVFHTLNYFGATASRFRLEAGPGMTMTYLSEAHPFPTTTGNAVDGVSICYGGACVVGDQLILSVSYMSYGTSTNCAKLNVMPHGSAETVEAITCGGAPVRAYAKDMYMLVDCGCASERVVTGSAREFDCMPVSNTTKTWGAIKALYSS